MKAEAKIQQFRMHLLRELRELDDALDVGEPTLEGDMREYLRNLTRRGTLSRLYVDFEKMMRAEAA